MKKKMNTITIAKKKIESEKGVVLLSLKEYKRIIDAAVPVEYLPKREIARLNKIGKQAMKEYKAGKAIKINSFADLL
jgi:hypothetical protein